MQDRLGEYPARTATVRGMTDGQFRQLMTALTWIGVFLGAILGVSTRSQGVASDAPDALLTADILGLRRNRVRLSGY
jgi:hypothetical protein